MERLYKRTKTGSIQQWYYLLVNDGIWTSVSGQLGGVLTSHSKQAKAKNVGKKNATNPAQQALLDAESEWRSKKDEGYKTFAEACGPIAFRITPGDMELLAHLNKCLPQFNTDTLGNVKPMLAPSKPWRAGDKKNKYPRIMEPKLDGVRATCVIDKKDNDAVVSFLSRSGKPYYSLAHLAAIVWQKSEIFPQGITILDGEIYKHGWTLSEINTAVKKYREGITKQLNFWVYDIASSDSTQSIRSITTKDYVKKIGSPLQSLPSTNIISDKAVQFAHDIFIEAGFEGGMLKDPNGTYQPGQRSSFWTKVKMFDDDEYKIVGYELGERGVEDLIFICESPNGSTSEPTFKAKMKGSTASKQLLFDDMENIIGKDLTVKHFGFTDYGIPNLPTGKTIRDYE